MLEFKSVSKRFGDRTILNDISFKTKEGEILFILGTSGTGKSVLLKLIVGLLKASEGEIWLNSKKISSLSEQDLFPVRRSCGMVFQHPALFDSMTVFENISFGIQTKISGLDDGEVKSRVADCLKVVDLSEDILDKLPSQLSYGMQKRVSLARTLALQPEVLLFDEPTTGLDPVTTQSVNRLIKQSSLKYNSTSLVVSHDMDSALRVADRILVLDRGKILEISSPEEIKRSKEPLVQEFLSEVLEEERGE